jgi:hypothetical protein
MDKLHICNKVYKCDSIFCSHRVSHVKRGICCLLYCDTINDYAHCELTNQGFDPEEIILKSFGGANG